MNSLAITMVNRGNQLLFEGRIREAMASYDTALEIEPASLTASQGRAFCRTLLLSQTPLDDHADSVKSIISDLESSIELSRLLLSELLGK